MAQALKLKNALQADESVSDTVATLLKLRVKDARRFLQPSRAKSTALHDLRISLKRLRYTVEIFEPLLNPNTAQVLARLEELQDVLGEIHDDDTLIELLHARMASDSQAELSQLKALTAPSSGATLPTFNDLFQTFSAPREGFYYLLTEATLRRRSATLSSVALLAQLEEEGFWQTVGTLHLHIAAAQEPASPKEGAPAGDLDHGPNIEAHHDTALSEAEAADQNSHTPESRAENPGGGSSPPS